MPARAIQAARDAIVTQDMIGGDDCTYLVICVSEKGASKKKWAGFERVSPLPQGPAKFARITLSFYSAADACDALHTYLKGKNL